MKFEIDDKENIVGHAPPVVEKILEIVQSMPDGKLYTTKRLAAVAGYRRDTISNYTSDPALAKYKIIARGKGLMRNLFGNANTIQAYKQEFDR